MTRTRDARGRFCGPSEPDLGPYWIECSLGPLGPTDCSVVDVRRPLGDGDGKGFAEMFRGSYGECDAWIEAHPVFHDQAAPAERERAEA